MFLVFRRCYICDDEVHYSRTGHLAQLVTNLKKQTSSDSIKRPQKRRYHWGSLTHTYIRLLLTMSTLFAFFRGQGGRCLDGS